MRRLRTLFGILAVAAMCPAFAAAASAHQFTSGYAPAITRGPGEGLQQLTLAPFAIRCGEAHGTGSIKTTPSATLIDEVKYTKCTSYTLPVKFLTPVVYEYSAEGFASIANTTPLTIKVNGISCLINIEDQRIPGEEEEGQRKSAIFSDAFVPTNNPKLFPTGFREYLVIRNRFEDIKYSLSGGLCEGLEEKEHSEGTGSGVLRDEIINADLGWK